MPALVIRHRLAFLVAILIVGIVLGVLRVSRIPALSTAALGVLGLFWVGLAIGGIAAVNARRPRMFQVRDGAFTAPPTLSAVLTVGAFTTMAVALACETVDEARRGSGADPFQIAVVVLLVVLLPVQWLSVLGPYGLSLRPDGLLDRQPLGSVFVPWEAGAAAEPTTVGIRLRFARPDLIVRRGLRPGNVVRAGIDRGFAAWAVNLYGVRPDFRPAIGTGEGLLQLGRAAG
jgi:hypothetical protein